MPDEKFSGKNIIITGAGGNFGREGCVFFAERGANIVGFDISESALTETFDLVAEKSKASSEEKSQTFWHGCICNVTSKDSVEQAVEKASAFFEEKTGKATIDMLWNNAGYQGQIAPTLEYDPADFARVMDINVTGMFIVLQAVAKRMAAENKNLSESGLDAKPFSIVNTGSVAGLRGTPAMVAYASSKAAVLSMTISTAKDLAPYSIRVNTISPALIGPGFMWDRQNELHAKSGSPYYPRDPVKVAESKINGVPLKRLGSIEEVLKSVAFLLSSDSSYTTATNLVVDGGMAAGIKS